MKVTPGKAEVPRFLKPANRLVVALQRAGLVIGPICLLSVPGRRSGRMRTTPVSPLTVGGQRYIVAVFEGARWVENAKAAGWGVISGGRKRERVDLVELPPEERVLVLREVPGGGSGATSPSICAPLRKLTCLPRPMACAPSTVPRL